MTDPAGNSFQSQEDTSRSPSETRKSLLQQ